MKIQKVKIIKCSRDTFWYKNYIGRIVNVVKHSNEENNDDYSCITKIDNEDYVSHIEINDKFYKIYGWITYSDTKICNRKEKFKRLINEI